MFQYFFFAVCLEFCPCVAGGSGGILSRLNCHILTQPNSKIDHYDDDDVVWCSMNTVHTKPDPNIKADWNSSDDEKTLLFRPIVIRLGGLPFNTLSKIPIEKTGWTLGNL